MQKLLAGQVMACTVRYNGHPALLGVDADLGPPFAGDQEPPASLIRVKAIWDTGASMSCITKDVADQLGLVPTGMTRAKTASGECDCRTYLVSLFLPSRVCFPSLRVAEGDLIGLDMLIGMDIIRGGDFAVSYFQGQTRCSFRHPSVEHIDFVVGAKGTMRRQAEPGRNDPCPCGSNKKYKNCCRPR